MLLRTAAACCCVLSQSEGQCFSLSALERRIGSIFFYWDVVNVLLQVGASEEAGGVVPRRACMMHAHARARHILHALRLVGARLRGLSRRR